MKSLFVLYCLCASLVLGFAQGAQQVKIQIDFDSKDSSPFPHYWERCVGSGRAYLGLREDWRRDLALVHKELGFQQVRFHDILDDDMNVYRVFDGKPSYSFYNVDTVYDYITSIGMRPLVELGFMPSQEARDPTKTVFWYKAIVSPPKSLDTWKMIITNFVEHLIDRYGLDEVWNEPNCGFFAGTQVEYYKFFQAVSQAIKAINPELKVGGPATCQNAWMDVTMEFIDNGTLSADFVSTHMYPTDFAPVSVDTMKTHLQQVRKTVGDFPLFYTEYNDGLYNSPPYHDTPYAGTFVLKNVVDLAGVVDLLSWWTFTDVFDEGGQASPPFGNVDGWGLLALYSIPKPSFQAFKLLHLSGTKRLPARIQTTQWDTVGALVTASEDDKSRVILLWNHNLPNTTFPAADITLLIANTGAVECAKLFPVVYRVDETHANPMALWQKMGSPTYPSKKQIAELRAAATLNNVHESVSCTSNGNSACRCSLQLGSYAIAALFTHEV